MYMQVKNCLTRIYKFLIVVLTVLLVMDFFAGRAMTSVDFEYKAVTLQGYYSIFYPCCCILLFAVSFHPFVEQDGRELLYVDRRMRFIEALLPAFILSLYMFLNTWLLFWDKIEFPLRFGIINLIIIFCYSGLCYGLVYLFSDIMPMIMTGFILMLYTISDYAAYMSVIIYPDRDIHTFGEIIDFMSIYLIIGIVGAVVGFIMNKRYRRY